MAGSLNKDGKKYALRSKSSIVSYLLDDKSNNYRYQLECKGFKPKNHHKQNLKHIEKIQKSLKQQQENETKLANIKNKVPAKYSKIDSKLQLKQTLISSKNKLSLSPKLKQTNFIKRNVINIHSQSSLNKTNKINISSKLRKPEIPKQSKSRLFINNKDKKDFVSMNKMIKNNYSNLNLNKNDKENNRFVNKKNYGKVPEYIIQRKLEKEELEMKKMEEKEANKIPLGMRKMSNEERLETLSILEGNRDKIIDSIKNLPLIIETPSMIRYESKLNDKLKEIEETIKIFEQRIVFVCKD